MNTEWDNEIEEIRELIGRKKDELYRLRCTRAAFLCPCAVGDIIEQKEGINRKKGVVVSIKPGWGGYSVYVKFILKNGRQGVMTHEVSSYLWSFTPLGKYAG